MNPAEKFALERLFETGARFAFRWVEKGRRLRRVARLLERTINEDHEKDLEDIRRGEIPLCVDNLVNEWLMVWAFALENVFKACSVQQLPAFTNGKLPEELKNHDLVELAAAAGLPLSAEDESLLATASTAAVFHGRYPVGTTATQTILQGQAGPLDVDVAQKRFEALFEVGATNALAREHARYSASGGSIQIGGKHQPTVDEYVTYFLRPQRE